jgi:lysophospholipid acyltransferase (LPLAT)-like uncharacterized protein
MLRRFKKRQESRFRHAEGTPEERAPWMARVKKRWLGYFAYLLTLFLAKTLRKVVFQHPKYNSRAQYLFAFWHGKQLLPILELQHHGTKRAVLVSASRDGDLLASWLKNLGYDIVRGSSRRQNVSALVGMMRKLREKYSLGFGVDGPIGPIYQVKPGMTYMAQRLKVPIIPVGSAFSQKWTIEKAWDKYEIPKPFAAVALYLGEPLVIEAATDLAACNHKLGKAIDKAEAMAKELLQRSCNNV